MQTQGMKIKVLSDGTVRFLVSEGMSPFLTPDATVRRASHVEPDGYIARLGFHALRFIFGEKGWMADFTRRWPCLWRINLSPTNGPILPGRWRDRREAISAEIQYLERFFL